MAQNWDPLQVRHQPFDPAQGLLDYIFFKKISLEVNRLCRFSQEINLKFVIPTIAGLLFKIGK